MRQETLVLVGLWIACTLSSAGAAQITDVDTRPQGEGPPAELQRLLACGRQYARFRAVAPLEPPQDAYVLNALAEAEALVRRGDYAAAWHRVTRARYHRLSILEVAAFGETAYMVNGFGRFGILWMGEPVLGGMSLVATCRRDGAIRYANSERLNWAPLRQDAPHQADRKVIRWGDYLRQNAFPYTQETTVREGRVTWRFQWSSGENATRREPFPGFTVALSSDADLLWGCPLALVGMDGARTAWEVPMDREAMPGTRHFPKLRALRFHTRLGPVTLSADPADEQDDRFQGINAQVSGKAGWTFEAVYAIPADAAPREYRCAFDLACSLGGP